MALALALASPAIASADQVTTFEDFAPVAHPGHGDAPGSLYLNDAPGGQFLADGNRLNNSYDTGFDSWYGWSISASTNTTTPGYTNQYSSITGTGADGSANYAVAFTYGGPASANADPVAHPETNLFRPADSIIDLAPGLTPSSIAVTNTTYAYLSMRDGDPFVGGPFGAGDFLKLDIVGYAGIGGAGAVVGDVPFFLGQGTDLVDTWHTLDLSSLAGSRSLRFAISGSRNDVDFGLNSPAYVAIDDLRLASAAVPEPAGLALLACGMVGLATMIGRGGRRRGAAAALLVMLLGFAPLARADFDPQAGLPGSQAIPQGSPDFQGWASSVASFARGPQDASAPNGLLASVGAPGDALGDVVGRSSLVSLGDGGSITLGFDRPIADGAGADFAVFENGFGSGGPGLAYLELAFVDVSSDGVHFFRFPSVSMTPTTTQVGGFGLLDATKLHDLAGKYVAGYGTGFDLSELAGVSPLLDIGHITEVRITDVVGSIDPSLGTRDSLGNLINDPFRTPFASSGFDLKGVGVLNFAPAAVPEPAAIALLATGSIALLGVRVLRRRPA